MSFTNIRLHMDVKYEWKKKKKKKYTESVRSPQSHSAGRYGYNILQYVRIFIRSGTPPGEIQPKINNVIERAISEDRKCQLSRIAEILCSEFIYVLSRPSREDEFVEPIHRALSSMDSDRKFNFLRKTITV